MRAFWRLRFARARNVQDADTVLIHKVHNGACCLLGALALMHHKAWLGVFARAILRKKCPFGKWQAAGENQRAVRIQDVALSALGVAGVRYFLEPVASGDGSVLGEAAQGTPAAMFHALIDGEVQRGAVHSGLATGDNLHDLWHWSHEPTPEDGAFQGCAIAKGEGK